MKLNIARHSPDLQVPTLGIIIKAGRRPWALERLLESLSRYCADFDKFQTLVIDDRSQWSHREALRERFPDVDWTHNAVWDNPKSSLKHLPYVEAWKRGVASLDTNYVLILEDDQWLARPLNLSSGLEALHKLSGLTLNLGTGSEGLHNCEVGRTGYEGFDWYLPRVGLLGAVRSGRVRRSPIEKLLSSPNWILRKISALTALVWPTGAASTWKTLAMVNPMCGAIYEREHWLAAWRGAHKQILENRQIDRIWRTIEKRSFGSEFLLTSVKPAFQTTYVSSMSLALGYQIDWAEINSALAEAWFQGAFPQPVGSEDWDSEALARIIEKRVSGRQASIYRDWVVSFRQLHQRNN